MNCQEQYCNNGVIFHTPPRDWWQGWLVGNGSGGATVWNPPEELRFQLGHTDLIDKAPSDGKDNCGIPNMRHNLRGSLHVHGVPMFDPFYLKQYHAETNIRTGITEICGESEFGTFRAKFFYNTDPDVFVLQYEEKSDDPVIHSFTLEKCGSRFFSRIWAGAESETSLGMGKTTVQDTDDTIVMTHEKEGFCMADVISLCTNTSFKQHKTSFAIERMYDAAKEFTLELRVCLGKNQPLEKCIDAAHEEMNKCKAYSFEDLSKIKATAYSAELPETGIRLSEDPYYENLWYLSRYYMRSCYKGKYPAFFINGPFGGDRDKREWADCWLHWNMHDETLGVIKNGDWDLFKAFADYKMRQIPYGIEAAKTLFNCGGMVMQDQQKPDGGGRNIDADYFKLQVYPCLQTSLLFGQYWKYTLDESFLREYLLPYLTLTLEFWKDYLVEEEGTLHVPRSTPYEFHDGYAFKDCLTELSLLKACLQLFIEVEEKNDITSTLTDWSRRALKHLAPFVSLPVLRDFVTEEKEGVRIYDNPFFYGEPYQSGDEVYAIGFSERDNAFVTHSHTHANLGKDGYGAFCSSQSSFIYPALLVCSDASPEWRDKMHVDKEQCKMWENGRNALRTIRRPMDYVPNYKYMIPFGKQMNWTGHSLEMPAIAKLGLKKPLQKALEFYTQIYQMFPQGMFNYHPRARWRLDYQDYTAEDGREIRVDFQNMCQHFSFEELGVFTETIDLMLLDSSNGLIRVFPCYDKDAQFKLPAEKGFTVEALQKNGIVKYIKVHSSVGGCCKIRIDWKNCILCADGTMQQLSVENAVVCFETAPDKEYILLPDANADSMEQLPKQKQGPRKNGPATLGLFPNF